MKLRLAEKPIVKVPPCVSCGRPSGPSFVCGVCVKLAVLRARG